MKKIDFNRIEPLLWQVEKPARYIGGEWHEIKKNPSCMDIKIALVFPDVYEVGMSYLGQKILYDLLNGEPGILAERVFTPWPDFEKALRRKKIPLYSLENKIPLFEFDMVGFSLMYELNYTNILTVLELGQIPLTNRERSIVDPLVIGGGPAAFNPEPVADFFDFFFIGDGEEGFKDIVNTYMKIKGNGLSREKLLQEFMSLKGIYVPSSYEVMIQKKSSLTYVEPKGRILRRIQKRQYYPFHEAPTPEKFIVPHIQAVFDRASVEVTRGCPQRCRFCQAASIYFPHRVKKPDFVSQKLLRILHYSGYDDASLSALSVSDYPYLDSVIKNLMKECEEKKIALSLPSLRPRGLTSDMADTILRVRKTGFTLVPEAGTERLRAVINKDFKDEDIRQACRNAFSRGWQLIKLYFMVGLPTETEEDLLGIVRLIQEIISIGYKELKKSPQINLSVSSFIPKPHTPFQWLAMENEESLRKKQSYLKWRLKKYRFIKFKFHPVKNSLLEAVFSRGDRNLSSVLLEAWKRGARFDSWADHFNPRIWEETFKDLQIDNQKYLRSIDREEKLPWDHVETGLKKSFLLSELDKSRQGIRTPSCLEQDCRRCRGCTLASRMEKQFGEEIPMKVPSIVTKEKKQEKTFRYRLFYSKSGPAVYISHRDFNHNLQRIIRRTGFMPDFTGGFHPKMRMTFLPALPLGMEGRQEVVEIYASRLWEESEFLEKMNSFTSPGIRFFGFKQQARSSPNLQDDIKGFLYSLNIDHASISRRLRETAKEKAGKRSRSNLSKFISDAVNLYSLKNKDPRLEEIVYSPNAKKIFLNIIWNQQNPLRPQDVLQEMLGIDNIIYAMVREKVFWLSKIDIL